jgi:hypothetical protein
MDVCEHCEHERSDELSKALHLRLGYRGSLGNLDELTAKRHRYIDFAHHLNGILFRFLRDDFVLEEELSVFVGRPFATPVMRADSVLVTSFGVFVIARISASGFITSDEQPGALGASHGLGNPDVFSYEDPTPVAGALKLVLRGLPVPVEAVTIFDNPDCKLANTLPLNMLKLCELHHFLRVKEEQMRGYYRRVDTEDIYRRLRACCNRPIQSKH